MDTASHSPPPLDRPSLFEFLVSRREELIEKWMAYVRDDDRIQSADELSRYILRDHMPEILMQIILALGRHKSGVLSPEQAAALVGSSEASKAHANLRFLNGYTLEEALREISDLRAACIDEWHQEGAQPSPREVAIFHACIDDLMVMAVNEISQRMNGVKDIFLARMSHEIAVPLTVLTAQIEKIMKLENPESAIQKSLELIRHHLGLLTTTVGNLKDLSLMIFGQLKLNLSSCELDGLATKAFEMVREEATTKKITIDMKIQEGLPPIVADSPKLQLCLANLLSNAVKYTPKGGHVSFEARRESANVVFEVIDTGEGISPEFLPAVFEQFRQEPKSNQSVGLGLGLAITRELVDLHNGKITVASDGKGTGSTFRISIPARTSH